MRERRKGLLILEPDRQQGAVFVRELGKKYQVHVVSRLREAEELLEGDGVDLMLVDYEAREGGTAFEIREYLLKKGHDVPAILMTAQGDEEIVVEALKRGFLDCLAGGRKNWNTALLETKIEGALQLHALRKENERLNAQIEESQQRLFSVYDSLDDVIMQIDEECRVRSVNRAGAALANRDPREAVGKVCWEVFDFYPCHKRKKKSQCHIYRTFREGETISGERRGESGRTYQYMTFITTHKGKDYTVYRETDVTAKRALEEKLDRALQAVLHPRRAK